MKREDNKSACPINLTVEIFGDTWSLLIVRDMLALGKKTFGEFLESEERIGPSVLADRLAHLEDKGIIAKQPSDTDKRKNIYTLTEKGLNAIPILYEISAWGSLNVPHAKPPDGWQRAMEFDRSLVIRLWREAAQSGSSFFTGPDSVVRKLGIDPN